MIYFDNAATTPLCDAARKVLMLDYGNPSSPHTFGLDAERAVKGAAKDIAEILSCSRQEIIFTSGGTEANNLGILGAAFALKSSRGRNRPLHILASNHEHPSVTGPLDYLAALDGFNVTYSDPFEFKGHITEDTALICITQVSSETGDVFDLRELDWQLERRLEQGLERKLGFRDAILFVDGAQGFCKGYPPLDADIYSFSGHKIHGPMGVGGLMVKKGLRLQPMMYGGGQQEGKRPGTENVPGILAMAEAAKKAVDSSINSRAVEKIKGILMELANEIPNSYVNHTSKEVSPYILNLSFVGVNGEILTSLLSSRGVYVSMGTACRNTHKDSALKNLGISQERAASAIRLSFSYMNTEEEAYRAKGIIKECVNELRKMNRR